MKQTIALFLTGCLMLSLAACGTNTPTTEPTEADRNGVYVPETEAPEAQMQTPELTGEIIDIVLNGTGITAGENSGVYVSNDIVYYEDKDAYESGNPYGEGEDWEKHTAREAAEHLVVNITQPGNYRLRGKLDLGQIRIDLGKDAYEDPDAVVNLILDGVDITCTVAPAILFLNVYECDGNWSVDTAQAVVDTAAAGANLILAEGSDNTVNGSHVAKIFKDKDGEKKLWKQDGAIYSYMSMNVAGTGTLNLYADNEGLDTELHLTINGGNLNIYSGNDGINTNEDGVSVTTINAGNVHIVAGLGAEGDGIDSNGYLVINGGTVVSSANPAADAGLDSDLGSYINGGYVIALGSAMDWAESDSDQVTINAQFARMQSVGSSIVIAREDGTVVFAYDPSRDEVLGENARTYMGAIISTPNFRVGDSYEVYIGAEISGTEKGGIYQVSTVTGFTGGTRQAYSGTDATGGFGGMGNMGGSRPEGNMEPPENFGEERGNPGERPEDGWSMPEGEGNMPQGGFPNPQGGEMPEGGVPGEPPEGGIPGQGDMEPGGDRNGIPGGTNTLFYMQDKVNFFSGLTEFAEE